MIRLSPEIIDNFGCFSQFSQILSEIKLNSIYLNVDINRYDEAIGLAVFTNVWSDFDGSEFRKRSQVAGSRVFYFAASTLRLDSRQSHRGVLGQIRLLSKGHIHIFHIIFRVAT